MRAFKAPLKSAPATHNDRQPKITRSRRNSPRRNARFDSDRQAVARTLDGDLIGGSPTLHAALDDYQRNALTRFRARGRPRGSMGVHHDLRRRVRGTGIESQFARIIFRNFDSDLMGRLFCGARKQQERGRDGCKQKGSQTIEFSNHGYRGTPRLYILSRSISRAAGIDEFVRSVAGQTYQPPATTTTAKLLYRF